MITTGFIRDCIIDKDRTAQIHGAIASGTSQYGMQTFDQSIFALYQQGFVTLEEALRWASNVDEFKLKVQGISTTVRPGPRRDGENARQAASSAADHAVRRLAPSCWRGSRLHRQLGPVAAVSVRARSPIPDPESQKVPPSAYIDGLRLLGTSGVVGITAAGATARSGASGRGVDRRSRICSRHARWTTPRGAGVCAHGRKVKGAGGCASCASCSAMGIAKDVAAEALAEVFADVDERALIAKALQKKMRGTTADRRSRRERPLYQYLMRRVQPAGIVARFGVGGREDEDCAEDASCLLPARVARGPPQRRPPSEASAVVPAELSRRQTSEIQTYNR